MLTPFLSSRYLQEAISFYPTVAAHGVEKTEAAILDCSMREAHDSHALAKISPKIPKWLYRMQKAPSEGTS